MAETALETVKKASGWSIVLGILMILAGMLAIADSAFAGVLIVYVVAWTAIFNGVAQIVFGFRAHSGGKMALEIILGLLYIAAGIYILTHPVGGLLALTLIIASFLVIYGIIALVLALQLRPRAGWGWVLFDALITILLGLMIWAHWPLNSEWVIGTLVGISLIVSGVSRLMLSMAVRKVATVATA
ncbi:MAG TPA: HdeD family acid-resistance protein [Candidatus Angelobacter sp.]|jgi:uncharacterized membrane protein HdeD (DUF308 family)|nr:HdeD family acid-resistance protein [Candidatus Angelobacter sp.]